MYNSYIQFEKLSMYSDQVVIININIISSSMVFIEKISAHFFTKYVLLTRVVATVITHTHRLNKTLTHWVTLLFGLAFC